MKKLKSNWRRTNKDIARLKAVECDKTHKIAVFLPSDSCEDLKEGLENGLIDLNTYLIVVERENDRMKSIEKFLKTKKFKNYYPHLGEVFDLDLEVVLKDKKVDYMFFDICGNLTAKIANWFNKYQDYFSLNMRMPTTLAIHHRKGEFNSAIETILKNENEKELDELLTVNNNLLSCNVNKNNLIEHVRSNCQVLYYAFSKRKISITELHIYQDERTPMILINTIIGQSKIEDETFKKIAKEYSKKVSSQSGIVKIKKTKDTKDTKIKITNAYGIARELGIFGNFESFDKIPKGKRAHITIKAKQMNIDPVIANIRIAKRIKKYGLKA
jgi:hypothetical protein